MIFSTVIRLYAVLVVVKVFRGLDLVVNGVQQAEIRQENRGSTKTKKPTTTEGLYAEVSPANPNLRPGVDETPQRDTRSIQFDVNAERIEKEVDEVTEPSPNQRLLRRLRVLRRTTNTT